MADFIDIEKLKPYGKNPRKHPKKQVQFLAQEIKKRGFVEPILITKDYEIIAGHGRVLAAKMLGWKDVRFDKAMAKPGENFVTAVVIDYMTPEEIRQWRITQQEKNW